ncbi:MAG: hypothetical protein M3O98_04580 [Actinomycetota bacterium]|nr:hypothetical protein [Actinomycetota bacterium]
MVDDCPELVFAADADHPEPCDDDGFDVTDPDDPDELVVVEPEEEEEAELASADRSAMFAATATNATRLSTPAATRDRAAAWRLFVARRTDPGAR